MIVLLTNLPLENSGGYTPISDFDSKNSSYHLASISGTSMSSPHGLWSNCMSCSEQEPHLTQAEALQHLKENALAEIGTKVIINHNSYFGSIW